MRLIDADELIEIAHEMIQEDPDAFNGGYSYNAVTVEEINEAPTVEAVPLREVFRIIAGHSDYHGDSILSALQCIAEGKEVKPIKSIEV